MKKAVLAIAAVCLLSALALAGDTVIEQIVARINNAIITRTDLQRAKEDAVKECQDKGGNESECQTEAAKHDKDVLRDLIDQQLLLQKGADDGITGDTELIKQLDDMRKQMNLGTLEDLQHAAEQQGISWEAYKQNMKNQIITQEVMQREVSPKINITKDEEKAFYDEHQKELERPESVRLSEILIPTTPAPDKPGDTPPETDASIAAAKQIADQVQADIKKGDKFEDVAKKYSKGPTAADGGDLGYFKRGTLAKQLEDTVFGAKPGTVTDPIRTKQGFVILKVTEHQAGGIPPMKDVEQQIQNALYYQKLQPALRAYLTKLREDAYIKIYEGYVDTGASPNQTAPVITTSDVPGAKKKLKKKKKFLVF